MEQWITVIARRIFGYAIIFFFLAGLINEFAKLLNLKWLGLFPPYVGGFSLIMLAINLIMPGILILIRVPWFARAWLRGLNPIAVSATPWTELSDGQIFLTYVWSLIISGFTLFVIIRLILQATEK